MEEKCVIEKLLELVKSLRSTMQEINKAPSLDKDEASDLDDEIMKCDANGQWSIVKKSKELHKAIIPTKNLGISTPSKPGNEMETSMRTPEERSAIRTVEGVKNQYSREKIQDMLANPHKYFAAARPSDEKDPEVQRKVALRRLGTTAEGQKANMQSAAETQAADEATKAKFRETAHRRAMITHEPERTVPVRDTETGELVRHPKTGNVKNVPLVQLAEVKEQQGQKHGASKLSATPSEFLTPGGTPSSTGPSNLSPADTAAVRNLQEVKERRTLTPGETLTREGNLLHSATENAPAHIRDGLRADKTLQALYNEKKKASLPKGTHDQIDKVIGLRRQELEAELDKAHKAK